MVESILEIIKKDLEEKLKPITIDTIDSFSRHFIVCRYIRNQYLWTNKSYCLILNQYFKTDNVDELSHAIFDEIRRRITPSLLSPTDNQQKH